jgi:hypothetical protein
VVDFEAVADELYGLAPSEFTSARDARAAEARQLGDRDTAASLKKLRKPSVGAWLANRMVRELHGEITEFLALAAELREAQSRLDGESMRRLSGEGRAAVVALVQRSAQLARDSGQSVSAGALHDVEATLDAALVDPDAAVALRSGRLTGALQYSGLGLVDAMAQSTGKDPADTLRTAVRPAADRELKRAHHELERVQAQLRDAEAAVAAARTTLAERQHVAERAARRVKEAEEVVRRAERAATPRRVKRD